MNKDKKTIPTNQLFNTAEIVNYSDDSIVSRIICESGSSNVSIFAFDEGQGLSEHTAPFNALVEVVDGEGEFIINGEKHLVKSGQLIVMPANIPHSVNANKRFKMILTMLRA